MTTPAPMLSLDDALTTLMAAVKPWTIDQSESVSSFDACHGVMGRVLAESVVSDLDVPAQDNSAMDGYALRSADALQAGAVLPVSQRVPAGTVPLPLQPGTAARIFTGAPLPPGADSIAMQEQCELLDNSRVRINIAMQAGAWVRQRAEDVAHGQVVLQAGERLTPQALGLAASVGAARLRVMRRPRVALFSTGDELVMPGESLRAGAVYNSNRFTLCAMLCAMGCDVNDLGIVPDRLDATRQALRDAATGHDLILTSGGVSMGEEDHLRPAVQLEGKLELWQIAIKPGKPLAFGHVGEAIFMGLPGNPVSSFVTFMLAVRPVLLRLQGANPDLPTALATRANFDWPRAGQKPEKRREFLRVRLNEQGGLELFANQSSGVLTSTVWGTGLVDNPGGQVIRAGDMVAYLPFGCF